MDESALAGSTFATTSIEPFHPDAFSEHAGRDTIAQFDNAPNAFMADNFIVFAPAVQCPELRTAALVSCASVLGCFPRGSVGEKPYHIPLCVNLTRTSPDPGYATGWSWTVT